MKDTKLTMAVSLVFVLSGTFALANTVHRKPGVRTHDLHRGTAQVRSGQPKDGNPGASTGVSAGGYLWNGRSASEFGGD
jgi:hypothetical protein